MKVVTLISPSCSQKHGVKFGNVEITFVRMFRDLFVRGHKLCPNNTINPWQNQ
jgi:hypothetical protein